MPDAGLTPHVPEIVLKYLETDLSFIPLRPGTKEPALSSWKEFQDRRPSAEEVAEWCAEFPSCNWGIVTGELSGLVVLDFDSGDAEVKARERGLPETLTVQTPRGRHCYFKHPGGSVQSRAGLFDDLDVRADGAYVVAPPSVGPDGSPYRWEQDETQRTLAELPDWVASALPEDPTPAEVADLVLPETKPDEPPTDPQKYALTALDRELEILAGTPEGGRNVQLNKSALALGQVVATGELDRAFLEIVLKRWALDSGLSEGETSATIRSGLEAGILQPRWVAPSKFKLMSVAEVMALRDPSWLVDGILPQGGLAVLFGDAGLGKSFLALDWACSVVSGRNWLERPVSQGSAVYVGAEGGPG